MKASPKRGRFPGFTFIELLLVVAIIGVAAGMALPRVRHLLARAELDNFAKDVYYTALFLQSRAVVERKIYCLNIDAKQAQFMAGCKQGSGLKQVSGRLAGKQKAPRGCVIITESKEIYFYPDGSMDQALIRFENADKDKIELKFYSSGGQIEIE